MRVQTVGVVRLDGVGKETGRPFDFGRMFYLLPIQPLAKKDFRMRGYGFEVGHIDVAPECVDKFAGVVFPAILDLAIDTLPGRQGLRSVVVGFRPAADVKAAA